MSTQVSSSESSDPPSDRALLNLSDVSRNSDSGTSHAGQWPYSSLHQSVLQNGQSLAREVTLAQRTRRGHKKSRQGCYNCKKRKIKCQESLPACDNCIRKSLACEYPLVKANSMIQALSSNSPASISTIALQAAPIFSLVDMRLFHHFLLYAYPQIPFNNEFVWVNEIPLIAHEYEYLMHSLLGLAASHLTITSKSDYSSLALSHRFLAIKGLNEALSKTPRSGHDGDALLASCYALAFQSSYMTDGLHEFLTFLRGCTLVSTQLANENVKISFNIPPSGHSCINALQLGDLPIINPDFIQGAAISLESMVNVIQGDANLEFYNALEECVHSSKSGSQAGCRGLIQAFGVLGKMDLPKFQEFNLPGNAVGRLLLAHFIALQMVMASIKAFKWSKDRPLRFQCLVQWVLKIRDELPSSMQDFIAWPANITTLVLEEIKGDIPPPPWFQDFTRKEDAKQL